MGPKSRIKGIREMNLSRRRKNKKKTSATYQRATSKAMAAQFCCQPGIVKIESANNSADIKCCFHRVKLKVGTRYFSTIWNNSSF
jgi:hypothetical protein